MLRLGYKLLNKSWQKWIITTSLQEIELSVGIPQSNILKCKKITNYVKVPTGFKEIYRYVIIN